MNPPEDISIQNGFLCAEAITKNYAETFNKYNIPKKYFDVLAEGMQMDLKI